MRNIVLSLLIAVAASAVFTGCTAAPRPTAAAPKLATFQIRLDLDAPSSDSTEMSLVKKQESPVRKEVVYVQNAVLLDQTALKSAKVEKDSLGHPQIAIAFTEKGRKRF